MVEEFVAKLRDSLDVPVETWDERLTTVAAERAMLEGNVRRARRRQRIDAVAAALLLQAYLDSTRREDADRS
jgi:putative Holliday junction resolvase